MPRTIVIWGYLRDQFASAKSLSAELGGQRGFGITILFLVVGALFVFRNYIALSPNEQRTVAKLWRRLHREKWMFRINI